MSLHQSKDEVDSSATNRYLGRALAVLCALLVFGFLGGYGLVEDSEARYVEMSWEMLRTGNWLTPHLNFISHFHKPPVTFWFSAASMACLGKVEWAARLPVAVISLFTVWWVVKWAKQQAVCTRTHLLTGLILITNVEFWALSRSVLTDMYLTLTVVAAQYYAWKILNGEGGSRVWSFWLWMGASFMVKGPVGPLLVGLTLLGYRLAAEPVVWPEFRFWRGLALASVIALPWYLWAAFENRGLLEYFVKYQGLDRYLTTTHGRGGPIWYFLPVLIAGFLPWTAALWQGIRRAWERGEPFDRFLLCWVAVPLVFFSFSGSKLPTYILPLMPALALLTGRLLDDSVRARKAATGTALTLTVLAIAVCYFLLIRLPADLAVISLQLHMVCAVLAFSAAAGWLLAARSLPASFVNAGVGFAVVLLILAQSASSVEDKFSAKNMAAGIAPLIGPDTLVAEVGTHVYGLPYYLRHRLAQVHYSREAQFDSQAEVEGYLWHDLASFRASLTPGRDYLLVLRKGDYQEQDYIGFEVVWSDRWVVLHRRKSEDPN